MSNAPLVSIIIPCYNAEDYIADAIRSALDQTHPNCEVIVIDDGSTDNSLEIIKSFGKSLTCETGPNRGGCVARNRGIEVARGDWIQFLDSDDMLFPDCVRSKLEVPRQEGEIICSSLTLMNGHPKQELTYFWKLSAYDDVTMIQHGTPQTSAPLHCKSDLNLIGGFNANLQGSQEYDLHLRLAFDLKRRFRVIDTLGVAIRPRPDSLSRLTDKRQMRRNDTRNILLGLYRRKGNSFSCEARQAFGEQAGNIARMLLKDGDRESAIEWIQICELLADRGMRTAYRSEFVATLARNVGYHRFELIHSYLQKFRKAI